MRFLFFLTIFIVIFQLNADDFEWNSTISVTGGWDSNVGKSLMNNKTSSDQNPDSSVFSTDILFSLYKDAFTLDYSFFADWLPAYEEYSRTANELALSYTKEIGDYDLSQIIIANFSTINLDKNLLQPEPYLFDIISLTDLFIYHSNMLNSYITFTIGYNHALADLIGYIKGPVAALELGEYIYPGDGNDYMKISLKTKFASYEDDSFTFIHEKSPESLSQVYLNKNKFIESRLFFKTKMYVKSFRPFASFSAAYSYWFEKDFFEKYDETFKGVKKRRIDLRLSLSGGVSYVITDKLSVEINWETIKNISSYGQDDFDYIDWNYWRHKGMGVVSYVF